VSAEPSTLRRGRIAFQRRRRREAIKRVRAFDHWLKLGAPLGKMPPRPMDWEFRAARRAGVRRGGAA
jgi:hypothetical protein